MNAAAPFLARKTVSKHAPIRILVPPAIVVPCSWTMLVGRRSVESDDSQQARANPDPRDPHDTACSVYVYQEGC
jgi:hypothetical protein